MVRLPQVRRTGVTSQAPRNRVSPSDIAAPFRMAADAMESFVPGIDATLEDRGEKAGFERSVTTGPDGLPTVTLAPPMSGAWGLGYDRAAKFKFLADMGQSIDQSVFEAQMEHAGNPAGFQAWADSYVREIARKTRDPELAASVEKMAGDATGRAYRGIAANAQEELARGSLASLNSRRATLENQLSALARNGGTDTPEFAEAMDDYQALGEEIADNPVYGVSPEEVAELDRQFMGRVSAEAGVGVLSRESLPRSQPTGDVVDRIIGTESGGDPNAANPESSAEGLGQFIDSTWLRMLRRYRPDIAEGASNADLIALKTDPALSREMTARLVGENTDALAARGHTASGANLYLAHFLGPNGATGVLEAGAETPVRDALIAGGLSEAQADAAIAANPTVLRDQTAGDVRGWARGRMGESEDFASLAEDFFWDPDLDLTPEERRRYTSYAQSEANRRDAELRRQSGAASEVHERQIIDAASGNGPLPSRQDIEDDDTLTESARNTLLRQYDAASSDIVAAQRSYDRFVAGGTFNPFDTDDRDALDDIYARLGGDDVALTTVVNQTGIAPPVVVKGLRGAMVSTDPERVQASMQLASNLLAANSNVFAGHPGSNDLRDAALTFRHEIDDLGYTAEEAAARIAERNSPEYQASVRARVENEDIDKIVTDNLGVDDIRHAFDPSIWPGSPEIGFSPQDRGAMFTDYTELFRDRYAETGDVELSKKLAADQLKRIWGVSRVDGTERVMRYPPEMAPNLAGVPSPGDAVAAQAVTDIEAETGEAVERDTLRLLPVAGLTADAYRNGEPVPYLLMWEDADGLVHTLDPGRVFMLDGNTLRTTAAANRARDFERARMMRREPGFIDPQLEMTASP